MILRRVSVTLTCWTVYWRQRLEPPHSSTIGGSTIKVTGSPSQMRHFSNCALKINGNNGIKNEWCWEMDLPTKPPHLRPSTQGTLAKQWAPSVIGQRKEWSVSIALRYWSIITGGQEVKSLISGSVSKCYNQTAINIKLQGGQASRQRKLSMPHQQLCNKSSTCRSWLPMHSKESSIHQLMEKRMIQKEYKLCRDRVVM